MFYFFRRRKLGLGSCTKIQHQISNDTQIIRSDLPHVIEPNSTILRWGCTTPLHDLVNPIVLNKIENIKLVNNKLEFRKNLQEQYLHVVPLTWFNIYDPNIIYPCIIRYKHHAQGKKLFFVSNSTELIHLYHTKLKGNEFYISQYIKKIKEYRICFIQGLVAWVATKIPSNPDAIAWNVNQGGKFENIHWKQWPIDLIENAFIAHKTSGLYLSGVDIMMDEEGRSFILEVNSAPSHTSPYRISCTAKCIQWGINNTFENLHQNPTYKKYMKWIHPALFLSHVDLPST